MEQDKPAPVSAEPSRRKTGKRPPTEEEQAEERAKRSRAVSEITATHNDEPTAEPEEQEVLASFPPQQVKEGMEAELDSLLCPWGDQHSRSRRDDRQEGDRNKVGTEAERHGHQGQIGGAGFQQWHYRCEPVCLNPEYVITQSFDSSCLVEPEQSTGEAAVGYGNSGHIQCIYA